MSSPVAAAPYLKRESWVAIPPPYGIRSFLPRFRVSTTLTGLKDTLPKAGYRSAVWATQGGEGQKKVLVLSTLPGVENVVLAPSQGHDWPRRAA